MSFAAPDGRCALPAAPLVHEPQYVPWGALRVRPEGPPCGPVPPGPLANEPRCNPPYCRGSGRAETDSGGGGGGLLLAPSSRPWWAGGGGGYSYRGARLHSRHPPSDRKLGGDLGLGVSAAMWGWEKRCAPMGSLPPGVPIPKMVRIKLGGGVSGVSVPVWGRGRVWYTPASPFHWVSLSPKMVCSTPGGTRVYPPLCGDGGRVWYPPVSSSHWASLSPKTICSKPGGLRCIPRCVGTWGECGIPPHHPPTGRPYPFWGIGTPSGRVIREGGGGQRLSSIPTQRQIHPSPPGLGRPFWGRLHRPEGLGCICRCVGVGGNIVPPCNFLLLGVPIPQNGLL